MRAIANAAQVFTIAIGTTGGDSGRHPIHRHVGVGSLPPDLRAAHEGFFPKLMGSELTPEF